jgi:hypothetical protein
MHPNPERNDVMAVPPRGTDVPPIERDLPAEPAPGAPQPLPDRSRRAGLTAFALIAAALLIAVLIAVL